MLEKYTFHQPENTDLNMFNCGAEDCLPEHRWGPGVRDHYIVHLVTRGAGSFCSAAGLVRLQAGQGFLICPGAVVEYMADRQDPWSYLWVGFGGLRAEGLLLEAGLSERRPVFNTVRLSEYQQLAGRMLALARGGRSRDLRLLGQLYEFLAILIEEHEQPGHPNSESQQELYLRQAIHFIAGKYAGALTVRDIAAHVGLDRSYLYSLFRSRLHMTPKEYLTRYRIGKAAELLRTPLTIGEIARSVGYDDALLFSKVFKRTKGMPPSQYRLQDGKNGQIADAASGLF
ncbi:MAG TPA: AraC family transcriptional regulator [Clostridiales bacterium]|nr:AraC family transcriptional regulator [Clostridiales bacterium]